MMTFKTAALSFALLMTASTSFALSEDINEQGVTREEALAKAAERFDRADTDNDGILSHEELKNQRDTRRQDFRERQGQRNKASSRKWSNHSSENFEVRIDKMFDAIDTNDDKLIDLEEFKDSIAKKREMK